MAEFVCMCMCVRVCVFVLRGRGDRFDSDNCEITVQHSTAHKAA